MPHSFLRDDGGFFKITPNDVGMSTSTTTSVLTFLTATLGSSLAVSSTGFTTGPSVTQGTSGIWFASGTVTFVSATTLTQCFILLQDGTTNFASTYGILPAANASLSLAVSGVISNPVGNIKIVARTLGGGTAGWLDFNGSGFAFDSTITAIRIG